MMAFKFSTILLVITALLGCLQLTQTASTTNGRLLKFYPISKEQYKSILRLAKQQPAVSEDSIVASHRSLADWSNSLHNSWNSLFNATKTVTITTPSKRYPMCVIKAPETGRQKRYAGVAPTVVYPGTYPYPYPDEAVPEDNEDYDDTVDEVATTPKPTEMDTNAPIINCVVVIKRKNPPETENPHEEMPAPEGHPPHYHHYPQYPYPLPHYGYPPHVHYPYPYPPYHHHHHHNPPAGRSNRNPAFVTPLDAANYQQMIAEYYRHLQALYMADAYTIGARSDRGNYAYEYDDNDDDVEDDRLNDEEDSNESYENEN